MVPPEVPQGAGLHFPYGFAAFNLSGMISGRPSSGPYRTAYGHLGATYGYQSILAYYPGADVAISVASNIEQDTQAPRAHVHSHARMCMRMCMCMCTCMTCACACACARACACA